MRARRCLAVLTAAAWLAFATAARAGTATVYQCVGPAGQPAATDMLSSPPTSDTVEFLIAHCGDPSEPWPLIFRDNFPAHWLGSADRRDLLAAGPPGTRIVGGRIERQMFEYYYSSNPSTASTGLGYRLTTANREAVLDRCGAGSTSGGCRPSVDGMWQFSDQTLELPSWLSTPALRFSVGCLASGSAPGQGCFDFWGSAGLDLRAITLRVADATAPVVASVTGSPASDQPVRRRELSITASDSGLGLFRVRTYVDGSLVDVQPFSTASTACRDVDPRTPNPYEFSTARACPTAPSSATVPLGHLPRDGEHALQVVVEDAAGNRTVALDRTATFALPVDELQCPRAGCVSQRGAPNGAGASPKARVTLASGPVRRLPYGRRISIAGRVSDPGGQPISGALLDIAGQTLRLGAPPIAPRQVRTGADGGFRVVLPTGPSRTVRIGYRARLGDVAPATTAVLRVLVRAAVRLALRPAVVSAGHAVRVRGRLLGGPFPRGTFAELQALDGREWRTFKTLAVGRRGRFAYRYRFRHTSGPARFLWRVHVRAQAGLPYDTSSSRPRWVLVR